MLCAYVILSLEGGEKMTTGEKIKYYRQLKGLTQKELGDLCGMADSAIRRYELGKANPKIETLGKIADALDIHISNLTVVGTIVDGTHVIAGTQDVLDNYKKIQEFKNSNQGKLLMHFNNLNDIGQEKALEQIQLLEKIDEYRKHEE